MPPVLWPFGPWPQFWSCSRRKKRMGGISISLRRQVKVKPTDETMLRLIVMRNVAHDGSTSGKSKAAAAEPKRAKPGLQSPTGRPLSSTFPKLRLHGIWE
jgi:hypothetical protein